MRLDTHLTESDGGVAGLSLAEEIDDGAPTAFYKPETLADWADELSDIDNRVEVGLQEVESQSPRIDRDTALALVARVPDSDVVCFAAPLLVPEPDGGGGDAEDETSPDDFLSGLFGWLS